MKNKEGSYLVSIDLYINTQKWGNYIPFNSYGHIVSSYEGFAHASLNWIRKQYDECKSEITGKIVENSPTHMSSKVLCVNDQ